MLVLSQELSLLPCALHALQDKALLVPHLIKGARRGGSCASEEAEKYPQ